ncbi:MAG: SusC/RagA family protein, partial [Muribaculaceae bacterium]|nr:SusC/RagA family protein [Muribaculaceae bacterium]
AIPVQTRDFDWTTSLNLAWQKDRIDELANGKEDDIASGWYIGERLGVFADYKVDGLWQDTEADRAEMAKWNANGYKFQPGMVKPVDQDGNYKMDGDDRVILGHRRPSLTAGWSNTFTYKGIDLSFQMIGRFDYMIHTPEYLFGYGQMTERAMDFWTPDNTGAAYQKPIMTSVQTGNVDAFASQLGYKKASFIRMRNISVGYNFPRRLIEKATLKSLKVYGQVINPFDLYQSVKGIDLDTGLSYYNRSWVIGLEIGF